jgi:formamidopyrimidine-DNA glycosylase
VGKKKAVSKNDIEGLVIPNKWDEKGKIIGIAIHTDKEEMFIVAHNRMEGELLNQLHIKVKIEGRIIERLDGNKLIHVRNFQPILDETDESN